MSAELHEQDIFWMQKALQLAEYAAQQQEVPVGAVLTLDNQLIAEAWNCPIALHDPTAHAEVVALRDAAQQLENYRLVNTTLYVTLEPCVMCVGALVHARIQRLVFGALDPKAGAVVSVFNLLDGDRFNHRVNYHSGVLGKECGDVLQRFFRERR